MGSPDRNNGGLGPRECSRASVGGELKDKLVSRDIYRKYIFRLLQAFLEYGREHAGQTRRGILRRQDARYIAT